MSVTLTRRAFTLIELIIVITIMGMVASLVSSRLSNLENNNSVVLTPATLKNYLSALHSTHRLDLLCYENCTQCDLWEGDKKIRTSLVLENKAPLKPHRFNRYGHLIPADPAIRQDTEGMRSGCFEFSLYPDGTTTPLILESDGHFIAYPPLSEAPISGNEEQLRTRLYDTTLMNTGSYYGSR